MADTIITDLTQAQTGYIDRNDEFVIQKNGETSVKKLSSSDVFGGWRDLLGPLASAKAPGVNAPTWSAFQPGGSGGLYQYAFAVNDEMHVNYHIDHDMKQSATMYPHMHWCVNGVDVNTVKWEVEYSIAARDGAPAFGNSATITLEAAPNGTAYSHTVTEDATGIPTPEVDALVLVRIARVTNGGVDNGDTVFGLTMDWHYPTEGYATKNRAPNFYT